MTFRIRTESEGATHGVAKAIQPLLRAGDLVLLSGELGGGKTAFVKGLALAMGITELVTSPTFTLAQTYQGPLKLHHLDVYRLNNQVEVIDLDLPELLDDNAVVAIEWGERILSELPTDYLVIRFKCGRADESSDVRLLEIETVGSSWSLRADAIASALKDLRNDV